MKLDDREWKDFAVPEIFQNIQRGKRLKNADHVPGIVPYVSSTANNNGVDDYIEATEGARVFKNCISLANSGSVGSAFYEPFAFVASDHVTSLKCREANQYIYLFLVAVLKQQGSNFNFNREINDLRIKRMRIMLPVTVNGEPDFQFMEGYVRELMAAKRKQYRVYIKKRLESLELDTANGGGNSLSKCEWKPLRIGDLFKVKRPAARNKDDYFEGNIPFVASGAVNNGVMKCCATKVSETLDAGNCITVSPVDGSSFYQPSNFLGRGGAGSSILMLYNGALNEYSGLFISVMIYQTCSKYTYGHMGNMDSIRREYVQLPVSSTGEPDFYFMEEYGKKMLLDKYNQYLRFLSDQEDIKHKRRNHSKR